MNDKFNCAEVHKYGYRIVLNYNIFMERKAIEMPILDKQDVVTCYAQQRPHREGGNIISKRLFGKKVMILNYGHGGAGVSLAPGSAIEAVKLLQDIAQKDIDNIAVIGSGIIGLFTCLQIINKYPSAKIVIYAHKFPIFGEKDNKKLITSQVAPGFWLPYSYGSNNKQLHNHLSRISLDSYQKMSLKQEYQSVLKEVEVFDITDGGYQYDYRDNLTEELKPTFKEFKLKLNNTIDVDCRYFKTIKIDLQPFLEILINALKNKGVKFINKKITSNQLQSLPENIIFNCAGLGNKDLLSDNLIKGIKGHLIEYKNPNPSKYNYIIKANTGKQVITYYMHDTRIILGLTRQNVDDCNVDLKMVELLQKSHESILEKFGIKHIQPKL